jgi:hypothetical protein
MWTMRKAWTGVVTALCLLVANVPRASAAITMRGTVPASATAFVIIQANGQTGARGPIKLLLGAPTPGAYALSFCIGPASNPCGLSTSYVVNVPGGEQRMAVVDASMFVSNVLVVGQGTASALAFTVTIE